MNKGDFTDDKIFLANGFLNMDFIISHTGAFVLIVGARGTGKTYGANKYLLESGSKFLYIRRTGTELSIAVNEHRNPFKLFDSAINAVTIEKNFLSIERPVKETDETECIGYASALSTFHNLRSVEDVEFRDIKIILYDECIPEKHVKTLKDEYNIVLNMYETVNRNRELLGEEPVKLVMLSNSNNMNAPIIQGLKISDALYIGDGIYIDNDRDLFVLSKSNPKFAEKKRKTALYRLTSEKSNFQKMAIDNAFTGVTNKNVRKRINYKEYYPLCRVETDGNTLHFLSHKTNGKYLFTTKDIGGDLPLYNLDVPQEKLSFLNTHNYIVRLLFAELIEYDSLQTKITVDNILKK